MPFTKAALQIAWDATLKGIESRLREQLKAEGWPDYVALNITVGYSSDTNPLDGASSKQTRTPAEDTAEGVAHTRGGGFD